MKESSLILGLMMALLFQIVCYLKKKGGRAFALSRTPPFLVNYKNSPLESITLDACIADEDGWVEAILAVEGPSHMLI